MRSMTFFAISYNRFLAGNVAAMLFVFTLLLVTKSGVALQPLVANIDTNTAQQNYDLDDEFVDDLDDDFDKVEAALEADFIHIDDKLEARFNAVHKAIELAYTKQTASIEVIWPNDVIVPKGSLWVAYSDDYEERIIYDFDQGFYEIEVIKSADTPATLNRLSKMAKKVSQDHAQTLHSLDVFSKSIKREVAKIAPSKQAETTATLNGTQDVEANSTLNLDMFSNINYEIMASVSAPAPNIDVEQVLKRLANGNKPLVTPVVKTPINSEPSEVINARQDVQITNSKPQQAVELAPKHAGIQDLSSIVLTNEGNIIAKQTQSLQADKPLGDNENIELAETKNGWSLKIPFVNNHQQTLVDQRLQTINTMSKRYNVDVSLILAIIEAESSFNPMATSSIPAFGLMQLVPKTAGIDAYRHVHGKYRLLSPEYLYDIGNNLELGTAYVDLLQNRYLRGIKDPQNKLYSMVASYNTGVGNLAKTLTGEKYIGEAVNQINKMQPTEYYAFLQANLPAIETRRYLDKIMNKKLKYKHLDNQ